MVEGQPCRLPEGMTGVETSLSTTPTTCQGMPSNVPPEVLAVSNSEGEGSLEISVPASPTIHSAGKVIKNARFALTSVSQTFDPKQRILEIPDEWKSRCNVPPGGGTLHLHTFCHWNGHR